MTSPPRRHNERRIALPVRQCAAIIFPSIRLACGAAALVLGAASGMAAAAPKLVSVFPFGAQRGTSCELEIKGTALEGAHAVWLGPGSQFESGTSSAASNKGSSPTKSATKS